jgi:hypothetical protein
MLVPLPLLVFAGWIQAGFAVALATAVLLQSIVALRQLCQQRHVTTLWRNSFPESQA